MPVEHQAPHREFEKRFEAMARSSQGVTVATAPAMTMEVAERVNSGEMTRREAERLIGYVVLEQAGAQRAASRTAKRRRRELREHGLVIADDFFEPVSVPLGDTLEAALAAWSA